MTLKIVPQGISVFGAKVWRNCMNAYHIAGGEPISLWGERRGPSWVGLLTSMGLPPSPPSLCWGHFPAWAGGGSIFWSVELSLWGLKLHADLKKRGLCLSQTCLGFSLGRQPRTGFGVRLAVSTYLIFCKSLDLVLIFLLVFLSLLTNGSSFLVFFVFLFLFFLLCHLRPSGPRIMSCLWTG